MFDLILLLVEFLAASSDKPFLLPGAVISSFSEGKALSSSCFICIIELPFA